MSPRVSIIVPSYNTVEYIAETLDSVFAQTCRDYEVVVVNDGSPDTPDLERVLAPYMERIRYLRTENRGLAGARNTAILASRGEFVALLDSDDIWEPNYLAVQLSMLDGDPSADIVYPNALIFGSGAGVDQFFMDLSPSIGEVTFTSLVSETCCVMVSVLARRTALEHAGLFDDQLRRCEDFDMWLRCVKTGSRIIYHRQPLVRYRRRDQSLSQNGIAMLEAAVHVLDKIEKTFPLTVEEQRVVESARRKWDGRRLVLEAKGALLSGDAGAAVRMLRKASVTLQSNRLRLLAALIRAMPRLACSVYAGRVKNSN